MSLGLALLDELDYTQAPLIGAVATPKGISDPIAQAVSVWGSSRTIELHTEYFTR